LAIVAVIGIRHAWLPRIRPSILAAAHAANETLQRPMKVIEVVCGALGVTLLPCDDERIVCG
jgi:hypothetical protein